MSAVWSTLNGLVDLVFPPRCLVCAAPSGSDAFCPACAAAMFHDPHLCCPRCAARVGPFAVQNGTCALCRAQNVSFEAAVRLGPYVGPLRDAVLRLKSNRNEGLAELLGERLGAVHESRLRSLHLDSIVPVPLYWWRRFQRGYNQSVAVARGLSKRLGIPSRGWWLWQVRRTRPQKLLSATQRLQNVRGAYSVSTRLDGKRVLLVDDVMTTGATAAEAARVLVRAGARVCVAILARAEG